MMKTLYEGDVCLGDVYGDGADDISVHVVVVEGEDAGIIVQKREGALRSNLVVVENCGGKLVCHVWAQKTSEDPTHSIEIEPVMQDLGAR
jgi:hypothetical protein